MITWMLRRSVRAFGRKYGYDTSYMMDVLEASPNAGARLVIGPRIVQYPGPRAARGLVAGAYLASTLDGDCGSCAQLVIDMAIESDVPAGQLRACAQGQPQSAGHVGLGFTFARAAIAGTAEADDLAAEIVSQFGQKALIAASFGAGMGRFYPVFKRGMGHGASCQKLAFGDATLAL